MPAKYHSTGSRESDDGSTAIAAAKGDAASAPPRNTWHSHVNLLVKL